jgi:hypothetical protein
VNEQAPLAYGTALRAMAVCVACTVRLLAGRRIRLSPEHVGRQLRFADGTSARVFRETVADSGAAQDPCVLVVRFRLRGVRGAGHAVFRRESLLNTPLFVGFPGFVSKLWLANDEHGCYRGLYEWDGPERAQNYARSLWRVLTLVSVPGSIGYRVLPGIRPADALRDPGAPGGGALGNSGEWWRVVETG